MRDRVTEAKRIVVKLGSNLLFFNEGGRLPLDASIHLSKTLRLRDWPEGKSSCLVGRRCAGADALKMKSAKMHRSLRNKRWQPSGRAV
jgi:hypothetical protein